MRKRLAVIAVVLVALLAGLAGGTAAPAQAKGKACWERVIDDWLNGKPLNKYSPKCLQAALKNVPEDLRDYSDITDVISAALQNKLRGGGMELRDAVITGASVRLRAELLSALIGSISLIPFIISSGTGAEIEKPLAIVVVGGLVTRPIKIVILPMVYEWVEHRAALRAARKAGADLRDEDNNTELGPPEQEAVMKGTDEIARTTEQGQQHPDLAEERVKEATSDASDGSHS